jgi:hypothetical protein
VAFGGAGDFDDEPFLVPRTYALPELPWESIAGRLEQVAIGVMRFDARLQASDLAAGWQSRCDMTEAVRALPAGWASGRCGRSRPARCRYGRAPSHPRAHPGRGRPAGPAHCAGAQSSWPLSIDGLAALRGVGSPAEEKPSRSKGKRPDPEDDEAFPALCQ